MSNTTTMFDYKGEIFSGRELLAIEIGREIEQERIIKLLKALHSSHVGNLSKSERQHMIFTAHSLADLCTMIDSNYITEPPPSQLIEDNSEK